MFRYQWTPEGDRDPRDSSPLAPYGARAEEGLPSYGVTDRAICLRQADMEQRALVARLGSGMPFGVPGSGMTSVVPSGSFCVLDRDRSGRGTA